MNMKYTRYLSFASVISIVVVFGCANPKLKTIPSNLSEGALPSSMYWPTKDWRTSSPEDQDVDSKKLTMALKVAEQKKLKLHGLLVIRNGFIISENYFKPYTRDTRHHIYSCTKSFVSTLVGIAIAKGYLDRFDRVIDFFPDRTFENRDALKEAITIEDLLTMRSGLDWNDLFDLWQIPLSKDGVQFVLDRPMVVQPGVEFNYNSGNSHILSAILQKVTGLNTKEFAKKELLDPLGISDLKWTSDARGVPIGGYGLQMTPRDMAKLGYLYLKNGVWDGRQIVSVEWVKASTKKHTDVSVDFGESAVYGYHWWINPNESAYSAVGAGVQLIYVRPDLELIIVTTATEGAFPVTTEPEVGKLIRMYIVPAVLKSL